MDFDRCGELGEGEYPAGINLVDIKWPRDVVVSGLTWFQRDDEMLSRLEDNPLDGNRQAV